MENKGTPQYQHCTLKIIDVYEVLIRSVKILRVAYDRRAQSEAIAAHNPGMPTYEVPKNLGSKFTIPITPVLSEDKYAPNVYVMTEDELKQATTTFLEKACILPETAEPYSKHKFSDVVHDQGKLGITKDTALYLLRNIYIKFRDHSERSLICPLSEEQIEQNKQKSKGLSAAKSERKCLSILTHTKMNRIRKAIQKSSSLINP